MYVSKTLANKSDLIVVTGAGGFIGGHLVARLRAQGYKRIRAVDIKPLNEWFQLYNDVDNMERDLKDPVACQQACHGADYVFNLAANMGGMGFIEKFRAECMLSVLISTNMLVAAHENKVKRFFYSSTACVYNQEKQKNADVVALKEEDAYPGLPENGYGWEKLFSERMAMHFMEDYGLDVRVARFHNVYGPDGTYDGVRAKAPASISRKVASAMLSGNHEIEIWGDGLQTRSFMFIDDCIDGILRIMDCDYSLPINLGSSELVTINQLVDVVEKIAGVTLKRDYNLDAPKGVRGRNSDNTLIKEVTGWEPSIKLEDGMAKTYEWVYDQLSLGEAGTSRFNLGYDEPAVVEVESARIPA